MLKLRNISNSYKSKDFIKNMSLDLPSRGMVFITSKKGVVRVLY